MHQAIYLPILSESTVKHVSCFFGCHHNQSRCYILDYNVLCWAVNRTILWEIHSRTHFCIITTKTYIEKKLCVPICRTGLVFSDQKHGTRLCFKIIFQLNIFLAIQKCDFSFQEFLKKMQLLQSLHWYVNTDVFNKTFQRFANIYPVADTMDCSKECDVTQFWSNAHTFKLSWEMVKK